MRKQAKISLKRVLLAIASSVVMLPLVVYGGLLLRRPLPSDKQQPLFSGIFYQRDARDTPRPIIIHIVTVDLTTTGINLLVTPGKPGDDNLEIEAQTTSEFLKQYNLQLAINGSFFAPFYSYSLWDYYPYPGDRVDVLGQAISNGKIYSPGERKRWVLCISTQQRAQIYEQHCPLETIQGLAGKEIIVKEGQPLFLKNYPDDQKKLFPRTVAAVDQSGEKLWLIIVDGRQPFYSEGVTFAELTSIVMELGVDRALNLDGGGSTTLVISHEEKVRTLNAPIHTYFPMRERPVANHLGIYALPKN